MKRILFTGGSGLLAVNWAAKIKNYYDDHLILHKRKNKIQGTKDHFANLNNEHSINKILNDLKSNEPVIINYCDFNCFWDYKKFKREIYGYDGAIVSFRGFHPSSFTGTLYCYLKVKNRLVTELREKKSFTNKPFEEFASTGIYYFKDFGIFKENGYKALKNKNMIKQHKEIYVSLPYIFLLNNKANILNFEVDRFVSLGTPKDLSLIHI